MTYRVDVVLDKPKSGMWRCGPNAAWVTVTHMQTMTQARAYHRHTRKAREMAMAEYFDRRDRIEPSGWWIAPALIVSGFAYAGIVALVLS